MHIAAPSNVVFLVAHPDDVAFSMGGTARLLALAGHSLHVICATRGERGYTWSGPAPRPPCAKTAATRSKEEQAACDFLGASLTFLDLIDGEIYADRAACERVAALLSKFKPRALFTMGPCEKPDHSAMHAMALKSLHLADLYWTTELYYPVRYGESYQSHPDIFVNISAVIEDKHKLCLFHQSHCPDREHSEIICRPSEFWGKTAWCDFAEAYSSGLPPMAVRWKRPAHSILWELNPEYPL